MPEYVTRVEFDSAIAVTKKEFKKQVDSMNKQFRSTTKQLTSLMALVELIPPLKNIVKEEEARTYLSKKIGVILGRGAAAAAIIGGIISVLIFWRKW